MKIIHKKIGTYAELTGYIHDENERFENISEYPSILVLPGGGFRVCSYHEGAPVAMAYYAEGFQAFVLKYTTVTDNSDAVIEDPMNDACEALTFIKGNKELLCAPGKTSMIGFSGGGHLAAAVSTHCDVKPDALILGYPGIVHSDLRALDCPDIPEKVDASTPPTFLFGMHGDSVTPPRHILTFACALDKAGVPFEIHMFHGKGHGLSLGKALTSGGFASNVNPDYAEWFSMSIHWLKDLFGEFLLFGVNDGRTSRFNIDRTIETLFSNDDARNICMAAMPFLKDFNSNIRNRELTPRQVNGFMNVLDEDQLNKMDSALQAVR